MRHRCLALVLALASWNAYAVNLISVEESKLPKAGTGSRAGLTRGPSIDVVSPAAEDRVTSPARIVIRFQPHSGARIVADSVKMYFLSRPRVELTDRIKAYVKDGGIAIPDAEMPPGTYDLMVQVTDSDGRSGNEIFTITVVK
jgi:hypothetical protein